MEERSSGWLVDGSSPPFDLQGDEARVNQAEDEGRCLPTSSGRAALPIRGEVNIMSRNPSIGSKRSHRTLNLHALRE
jgi:hypothetical protein